MPYLSLLEFQALSYIFVLLLYTVAYSSYAPIQPYSATLIFDFISSAGLDRVLDSIVISSINLTIVAYVYFIGGAIQIML